MRRQKPNVERMGLLGAEVRARRLRHEDAEGGDERGDPRLDHERRDDALPDRLVRRPRAVPGARRRAAVGDRARGARADPRRRGAAARGGRRLRRRRLERDRHLPRLRRRRGRAADRRRGGGRGVARHRPRRACCTARARRSSPTRTGRSPTRTRSRPGSTIPGVGPEHAFLRDSGRAEYVGATDEEALAAFARPRAHRGDHPRARAGARARARARARRGADPRLPLGRGDKDLAEALLDLDDAG